MLRIYSAKWHIYAGLALLNSAARKQVTQYADSATDLLKLMVAEDQDALFSRTFAARRGVFGWADDEEVGGARTCVETGARERKPTHGWYLARPVSSSGMKYRKSDGPTTAQLIFCTSCHCRLLALITNWSVCAPGSCYYSRLSIVNWRVWIPLFVHLHMSVPPYRQQFVYATFE